MTLLGYSLGMTGNQDETGRSGPEGVGWARTNTQWLRSFVDEAILAVSAARLEPGDVAGADRMARAVVNIGRAIKTVEGLSGPGPDEPNTTENPEDEMSERREYTPERLAAMRDELFSRCVDQRDMLERKRAARDVGGSGAGEPSDRRAEPGGASETTGGGLADLGDAGRPGSGQDLCGGLLAA